MPISRAAMIKTGKYWKRPIANKENMHPRTTTLSARGSRKAPNLVSLSVALASTPSKASLMPKTNPKINAVHDAPFSPSAERITMNRIGDTSIRVIVIKFAGVKLCIQISFGGTAKLVKSSQIKSQPHQYQWLLRFLH